MTGPTAVQRSQGAAIAAWAGTLAATAAGVATLHSLGSHSAFAVDFSDLWSWIGAHSAERVLLGLGRLGALGMGYWVLASLLISTATRATRIPVLIRSLDWVTLPAVRRLADRVAAVSLVVSSVATGSAGMALAVEQAEPDAAAVVRVHQTDPADGAYVPVPAADTPLVPAPTEEEREVIYTPVPAGETEASPIPAVVTPSRLVDPAVADLGATAAREAAVTYEHAVVAGDNLWSIAAGHLGRVLDRSTSDAETATYWAYLVETNRHRLRSGDPDLIFPGEIVVCPATTDVGLTG